MGARDVRWEISLNFNLFFLFFKQNSDSYSLDICSVDIGCQLDRAGNPHWHNLSWHSPAQVTPEPDQALVWLPSGGTRVW